MSIGITRDELAPRTQSQSDNPLRNGRIVGVNVSPATYTAQRYHRGQKRFVMSRGELVEFAHCPARWRDGYESEETASTEWGTMLDAMVLAGNGEFEERYAVMPAKYPHKGMQCPSCGSVTDSRSCAKCKVDRVEVTIEKDWDWNSNYCKAWREQQGERTCIKFEQWERGREAAAQLHADKEIRRLIKCSRKQVMVRAEYEDKATGLVIPLRCLIDLVPSKRSAFGKCLADLKTCRSGDLSDWTRAVDDHGYHIQGAIYLDAYNCATGEQRHDFLHALQENFEPWQPGKRSLSPEMIELGRRRYTEALQYYCQCLKSRKWPGYERNAMTLNGWAIVSPEAWMVTA